MDYMGNQIFWDRKFEGRGHKLLSPEVAVVENIGRFKQGTVLDLACGDGRNALFLMKKGFKVTGVDFSSMALKRLAMFAEINNYSVNTLQIDLSKPGVLKELGIFDNILINHYRMNKEQLREIDEHISEEGILFVCGFGHNHKTDLRVRQEDLIRVSDFEDISKSFELLKYQEKIDERGVFVTYIFQKKKSS